MNEIETFNISSQLVKTLSDALYRNKMLVFEELVSNSYDAGASKVSVEITPYKITFTDNGTGMDSDGIKKFLYLASTHKQDSELISFETNRRPIGKFGIGKLSMNVVCHKVLLETTKDKEQRTIIIDFDEILSSELLNEIKFNIAVESTSKPNGTKIVLEELKSKFIVGDVKSRLIKSMPIDKDFVLFVNGDKLVSEYFAHDKKHDIDIENPKIGRVYGALLYKGISFGKNAGISIKVNKRTIDLQNQYPFDFRNKITHANTYAGKIKGIVEADGLNTILQANRGNFAEDSEEFQELQKILIHETNKFISKLEESKKDFEEDSSKKEFKKSVTQLFIKKENIKQKELKSGFKSHPESKKISKAIIIAKQNKEEALNKALKKIDEPMKVLLKKANEYEGKPGSMIQIGETKYNFNSQGFKDINKECIINPDTKNIYVNTNHPQYKLAKQEGALNCYFRHIIAFELSLILCKKSINEFVKKYHEFIGGNLDFLEEESK